MLGAASVKKQFDEVGMVEVIFHQQHTRYPILQEPKTALAHNGLYFIPTCLVAQMPALSHNSSVVITGF
jgi:hypothetical protein